MTIGNCVSGPVTAASSQHRSGKHVKRDFVGYSLRGHQAEIVPPDAARWPHRDFDLDLLAVAVGGIQDRGFDSRGFEHNRARTRQIRAVDHGLKRRAGCPAAGSMADTFGSGSFGFSAHTPAATNISVAIAAQPRTRPVPTFAQV